MTSIADSHLIAACLDHVRRNGRQITDRPKRISPSAHCGAAGSRIRDNCSGGSLIFVEVSRVNAAASHHRTVLEPPPHFNCRDADLRDHPSTDTISRNSSISFCFDRRANLRPYGERSTLIVVELSKSP
jgi:hypothetical protein